MSYSQALLDNCSLEHLCVFTVLQGPTPVHSFMDTVSKRLYGQIQCTVQKDCFIRYEVTAHFQCMEDRQKNGAGNERITAQDKKITCINSDSAGNGLYVYICFHSNERYKSHCERTTWKTRKFASASSSELMRWEQHMLFLQNHSLIHSMIQYMFQ